jgi:hypothetical protein
MAVETLEQRLTDLALEVPDPDRVTARVLSNARIPRKSRLPRMLALVAAVLVIASAVLYFVPAADAALAGAPIAGNLLRDAGLVGAGNRVTSVGSVSTSAGYRLELIGAYADSTRTVLLIRANPAILPLGLDARVTDQFGRSYFIQSGQADSRTGEVIVQLGALAWPDAVTGARITLKVTDVVPACPSASFCSDPQPGDAVSGSWALPAIIGMDEGTVLALPAPGRLGKANFRFTSVVATPATIAVDIEVTGMPMTELDRIVPVPGNAKGAPALNIDLVGPDGSSYNLRGGGAGETTEDLTGVHLHIWWPRDASASGDYQLKIVYAGLGEIDRTLHIP